MDSVFMKEKNMEESLETSPTKPLRLWANKDQNNCLACCFAGLIGKDLNSFPNFMQGPKGIHWYELTKDWLNSMGYNIIYISPELLKYVAMPDNVFTVRIGKSAHNHNLEHAVIFEGERIYHDPNKSNEALTHNGILNTKVAYLIVRN